MPKISTPSKISGTRDYTPHVRFSGSTSIEREAVVAEVIKETGAILVPPYDHPDIMLGQGTAALELNEQYEEACQSAGEPSRLRAVLVPVGGGGLLSGTTLFFSDKPTLLFGCEPSYQGGDDLVSGLHADPPKRVENVKTLTIADGLRTPIGIRPWSVLTARNDKKGKLLEDAYSVTEEEIKGAMRLLFERLKVFVEPSGAVPLAVVLYNEEFRRYAAEKQAEEGTESWDVGIVISGGNSTIEAVVGIFGGDKSEGTLWAESNFGADGRPMAAENVAA